MHNKNKFPWLLLCEKLLTALILVLDGAALAMIAPKDRLWGSLVIGLALLLVFLILWNFFWKHRKHLPDGITGSKNT
jgi:protein-S-isoprenylcysteine O-methyltransferase Ste14